jgi:hypothetical protein
MDANVAAETDRLPPALPGWLDEDLIGTASAAYTRALRDALDYDLRSDGTIRVLEPIRKRVSTEAPNRSAGLRPSPP